MAHRRRRQPQRRRRGQLPQGRRARLAPRVAVAAAEGRAGHRRQAPQFRLGPFLRLRGPQHVRRQPAQPAARRRLRVPLRAHRPRRRPRPGRANGDYPYTERPGGPCRRPGVPRLPMGLGWAQAGPRLHRPARRLLHGLGPVRPFHRLPAARTAGGRDRGPRRDLQGQPLRLWRLRPEVRRLRHAFRRDLLPDPARRAGAADHHQGRRRRRGGVRRRRQSDSLQRHGRRLHPVRGDHRSQHQPRLPGGAEGHRRRQRLRTGPFTDRRRGARRPGRVGRLQGPLYRRRRLRRPP